MAAPHPAVLEIRPRNFPAQARTLDWLEIIDEEEQALRLVQQKVAEFVAAESTTADFDRELLTLRDELAESRAEDQAALVEHMTRLAALREAAGRSRTLPADTQNPYFAHVRLREADRVTDVYIGRRAFIEPRLGVHITDWRNSPISRIFYRYEEGDEYEEDFGGNVRAGVVEARRTLTVHGGRLVRVRVGETQWVRSEDGAWGPATIDVGRLAGGSGTAMRAPELRRSELRGVDQRLPEITSLIDKEQFAAITTERSGVVIIRGGAGTGKTTIGLHRAAWLHFQDPKRYVTKRMCIVTPGSALARYIAQVLPSLEVPGVPIVDFPKFALESMRRVLPRMAKRKTTDDTPSEARRLKRHPAMLRMLEKAVAAEARTYDDVFKEVGGEPMLRAWVQRRNLAPVPRLRALEKWAESAPEAARNRGDLRIALRQAMDTLGDPVETWASLLTDRDRLRQGFAAQGEHPYEWAIEQLVEAVAKQSDDPPDYRHIDADRRQAIDGKDLDTGDLQGRLDVDDMAILLRLCQLKYGTMAGPNGPGILLEHLMVDEAQDFSPLSLKVLLECVRPGGPVTLAGDTAQRIWFDNGFDDWDVLVRELGLHAHMLPPLAVSYRSTRQVMDLARHVLGPLNINPEGRDARDGAPVEIFRFDEQGEAVAFLAEALKNLRRRERNCSVALVSRTPEVADLYFRALERAECSHLRRVDRQNFDFSPGVDVTDVYQVKGLEYDYIVLLEATAEQYPDATESRHLMHVGATRAAHQLWLVCSTTPSPLLPTDLVHRNA
jgi:DNA helicase-2/ATP-dependent DNA helicase PcrA